MKAAAYIRCSTEQQTTDNQLPAIEALCKARGWELVKVYSENASAWHAGRQSELKRCIADAKHNHHSIIVIWALDRLSPHQHHHHHHLYVIVNIPNYLLIVLMMLVKGCQTQNECRC